MGFLQYLTASIAFSAAEQTVLADWYDDFTGDPAYELIRRNFDCEADRQDIDHVTFRRFLRQVAARYSRGQADPNDVIQGVFTPSLFLLPGKPLAEAPDVTLLRCTNLYSLLRYNLQGLGLDQQTAVNLLGSGGLSGVDLEQSMIGAPGRPVWVTKDKTATDPLSANELRDELGLKHVESGHLVMMEYTAGTLASAGVELKAPTVLDGHTASGVNWIFAKRGAIGGAAAWGHTAALGRCAPGPSEAVHAPFLIDHTVSAGIKLAYRGVLSASPSACDYTVLYGNL